MYQIGQGAGLTIMENLFFIKKHVEAACPPYWLPTDPVTMLTNIWVFEHAQKFASTLFV